MSSPEHSSLAARILPTRGAAQKASASFAGQLMDSPTRSEGERSDLDPSGSSIPFGEPSSHRTKPVKYRYSATGKHRSSPLKGNNSSPEHTTLRKAKPTVTIKTKPIPMTSFTPAPQSNTVKGKARAVASTSRKRKAPPSSLSRREDTLSSLSVSLSPSPLSSVPTSPIMPPKDLRLSPTLPMKRLNLAKRFPVSNTLSMPSLGPTTSKLSVYSLPLSSGRKQKQTKPNGKPSSDTWDVGNSVWVLVNDSGAVVDPTTQQHDDVSTLEQLMWWPAQIVQSEPLRVSLFGVYPSSSSSSRGLCTIFTPSPSNIQSICDDTGSKRFTPATFCISSSSADDDLVGPPPAKKPRLDEGGTFGDRWESAVQSMEKASTLEQDGLPALISSYASAGNSFYDSLDDSDPDTSDLRQSLRKPTSIAPNKSKPTESTKKLKVQRSRTNTKDDASVASSRSWSPCPPDPTLQIPGELVLALAPRTGGVYWPAQLLAHVPDRKEKYKVKFLDDKEHVITRDRFLTSEEEGFVRCTLGEWESAVKTDDAESGDEGEENEADGQADTDDPTGTSLPPPPPADDFDDLSLCKQLAYVKPVLRAILDKGYGPAMSKHEAFMRGGSARVALLKAAGIRGGLDARFVKAVQKAICKWVLGGNGVRPKAMDVDVEVVAESSSKAESENGVVEGCPTQPSVSAPALLDTTDDNAMQEDKMEGIKGIDTAQDAGSDKQGDAGKDVIPSTSSIIAPDKQVEVAQDAEMVVDHPEQKPVLESDNMNDVTTNTNEASLGLKGQLDLLAEVSQAVAIEPSLLPSHPDLPRIKIDTSDAALKNTSDVSSQPSPLTPMPEETPKEPGVPVKRGQVGCDEFESLSGVEKLDYCLNILLPECIQQLLLWRSGERTSPTLLSPEEEQRLHDVAARKAAETDWVDDVMRLRAAQARLWGVDLSKKVGGKKAEAVTGGTRSRPRRATISR